MMTLQEAIAHYKERARTYIDTLKPFGNKPLLEATKRYIARQQEFARKYEQLADWLEELAERREADKKLKETLEEMSGRLKDSLFGDGIRFALKVIGEPRKRDWESEAENETDN